MLGTLLKWFKGNKPSSIPSRLSKLYEGDRGIHDLEENSDVLRLWLPEPLKRAMDECTTVMEVTASKYLRELFVIYLYGGHELLRMREENTGLYYISPPSPPAPPVPDSHSNVMFSRAATVDCILGLGKNIVPVKIYVPPKIKADLELLAIRAEMPLARFIRELLVSHFLGHTIWPERMSAWSQNEEKIASDWECGITVEKHVDEEAWLKADEAGQATSSKVETIW